MEKKNNSVRKLNEETLRPVDSLTDRMLSENNSHHDPAAPQALFQKLSILDRLLTPAILVCMIVGVVIGEFVPGVQQAFDTVKLELKRLQ